MYVWKVTFLKERRKKEEGKTFVEIEIPKTSTAEIILKNGVKETKTGGIYKYNF